jgi:redox-sensitive bicupin YhaK (pirin superfamily)
MKGIVRLAAYPTGPPGAKGDVGDGPKITLRRASDRHHDHSRKLEAWLTFDPQDPAGLLEVGLGNLELLKECRLAPGAGVPRTSGHDTEILTYVREGALAYENSMGGSGVVQAGEFQRVTAGRGLRRSQTNASRTDWAHFFQIWLHPSEVDLDPGHEQKRFTAAQRRGGLCVVASPDARRGSLRIHQDALIYSALLDPGQHVVRELSQGRSAWLHVVQGEVTMGDIVLCTGDGAGVTAERAVSLTAREESEILLVDLAQPMPRPVAKSG